MSSQTEITNKGSGVHTDRNHIHDNVVCEDTDHGTGVMFKMVVREDTNHGIGTPLLLQEVQSHKFPPLEGDYGGGWYRTKAKVFSFFEE